MTTILRPELEALDTELKQLEALLESALPGNPNRRDNERLEKDLEKEVREYFIALLTAFPWQQLEMYYYQNTEGG